MTSSPRLKKVVHVITSLNDGGAEAVLTRLVLNNNQQDHLVVSLSGVGKYTRILKDKEIQVIHLNLSRKSLNIRKLIKLVRILKTEKPDAVQTWMYHADLFGGLASRFAGIKNVLWGIHNTSLDRKLSSKITRFIVKVNSKLSWSVPKKIISCSNLGIKFHQECGYDIDKMIYIPNGYDFSVFRPDQTERSNFRLKYNVDEETTLIGCVARYSPQKDHVNLLQAFKLYSEFNNNTKLMLIGNGMTSKNKKLCDIISELKLTERIILTGQFENIVPAMNGLDIHVLPSAFGEAFPNVLCEAIACQTICVATDVGDSKIIVDDQRLICEPKNYQALLKAIQLAASLDKHEYRAAARSRVIEAYSVEKMVNDYTNAWFD